MNCYSVCLISVHPWQHVVYLDNERAAQIMARLLQHRFPGSAFNYSPGPDLQRRSCHPGIRDCAVSIEIQRLVLAEIILEAEENPERLPKWCAFQFRNGGVCAHLAHDLDILNECRGNPEMVRERALYAKDLTPGDVLDCFRTETDHPVPA